MTNEQKFTKGDQVRLMSRFGGKSVVGTLQKGVYHKETKSFVVILRKDNGNLHYFLGKKDHFSLEKLT